MLIFNPCGLGSSIGVEISGCSPAKVIKFGVDTNHSMADNVWDAPGSLYDEKIKANVRAAKDAATELANTAISLGKVAYDKARPIFKSVMNQVPGGGLLSSVFDKTPDSAANIANKTSGFEKSDESRRPRYGVYGKGSQFSNRAQVGIDEILKPLGLVLGISLDFQDPANCIGIKVEAGAMTQLYQATISGIIFNKNCSESVGKGRHGLEALLEYFYHHRVTNTDKDLDSPTIKIGYTVLRGWVVGMTAEPMNLDYQIWKWAIHMLINPDYIPESLVGIGEDTVSVSNTRTHSGG